jgi:hypothetical protein
MSESDGGVDLAAMSESDGGVFDQSVEYENMLRLDAPATHEVAQDGTQVEEEEEEALIGRDANNQIGEEDAWSATNKKETGSFRTSEL